jgi:hypothetical protein
VRWHVIPAAFLVALVLLAGVSISRPAAAYPVSNVFLPLVQRAPEPCSVAPTLIAPANGAQVNTLIPLYQYDNGTANGVTRYGLEVATDASFAVLAFYSWSDSVNASGARTYRSPWNLTPATTYYWRTYLTCGTQRINSSVWTFRTGFGGVILSAPSILQPASGSTITDTRPLVRWTAVPGAVEYLVDFWDSVSKSGYLGRATATEYQSFTLKPNTRYDLKVSARNDYAWGYQQSGWSFTTGATAGATALDVGETRLIVVQVNEAGETVVSVVPPTD